MKIKVTGKIDHKGGCHKACIVKGMSFQFLH